MAESVKQLPRLKKRILSSKQKRLHNFALGAAGEQRASAFLHKKAFRILDMNFCDGPHEVDIVAIDPAVNELVFVEVKTRQQDFSGSPSLAVGRTKLRSLQQAAAAYRRLRHTNLDYRFDTIAVLPHSIEHYENISWGMVK